MSEVIEIGTNLQHTPLEYVYVTIPAEYICVYHRILAMLADYGEEMLKDCKATCKDRNSGVIECFNMFNAAVAARKLGKDKLAEVLIKYIKTKINQIYKNNDNSTSFVFPVDETGNLKAFVSCGERPKFWISAEDGELYEHKFDNGFDEHFQLGPEDESPMNVPMAEDTVVVHSYSPMASLDVTIVPSYEKIDGEVKPCADIYAWYKGNRINLTETNYQLYFDDTPVIRFNDVINLTPGTHNFKVVVLYKGVTGMHEINLKYVEES